MPNPNDIFRSYLTKIKQEAPTVQDITLKTADGYYRIKSTAKTAIVAPDGYSLLSLDYKSQEMYITAVVSEETGLLKAFLPSTPVFIRDDQGKEYPNPDRDLHTLAAANCIAPEVFKNKPLTEWVSLAENTPSSSGKGTIRDNGKVLNFGIIYDQSAQAMADLNYLTVEVTSGWLKNHQKAYPQFHRWKKLVNDTATARGWINSATSRIRFCNESNSKGADDGSTTGRMAVNHSIQSVASCMAKEACVEVSKFLEDKDAKLLSLIHDELIIEAKGDCLFNPDKSKLVDGVYTKLAFDVPEQTQELADKIKKIIEDSEARLLNSIRNQGYVGLAEVKIAPFWNH